MKHALAVMAFVLVSQLCSAAAPAQPPSIIYMIGDGMGMEYLTAYRHFADDPATDEVEATLFDQHLVGTSATHAHGDALVTDSAASATALATGTKTYNGAVGLDVNNQPLETLLERAKRFGYSTAMVATTQINHATPASFAAHIDSRHKYNEIADQYLDNRHQGKPWVDVLIGGGVQYFQREDRDLVAGFSQLGYQYATDYDSLARLDKAPALALLAPSFMPFAIDQEPADRLAIMTAKALELMPKDKPFFLMVESSLIDWCGHTNDIACAMAEMRDTELALQVVLDYIAQQPNTIMVMTADHSTGGLSIGASGEQLWRPEVVHRVKASIYELARTLHEEHNNWHSLWQQLTGITLKPEQKQSLASLIGAVANAEAKAEQDTAKDALRTGLAQLINSASATGWTTDGHTGGDVSVMAAGVNAQQFAGYQDNTDIAKKLFIRLQPVK